MLLPKIIWNDGTPHTLNFTYPPVQKPGTDELVAERHDSITSGGVRQSVTERVDTFRTLQMDFVPMSDLANWSAFMAWALQGGAFDYYPDATSGSHESWLMEDTDWNPAYAFRSQAKFKVKLRKVVTP